MLIAIYLHGMEDPLARDLKDIYQCCEIITDIGLHRIEKVVILDFSSTTVEADTIRQKAILIK